MSFTQGSYSSNSYTDASAASAATAETAPQTQAQALPEGPAPGFDLVDSAASVLFAPGRAVISAIRTPTMKDLPLVVGISAVTWWLLWKYAWPHVSEYLFDSSNDSKNEGVQAKPKKKRKMVEVEVEEED